MFWIAFRFIRFRTIRPNPINQIINVSEKSFNYNFDHTKRKSFKISPFFKLYLDLIRTFVFNCAASDKSWICFWFSDDLISLTLKRRILIIIKNLKFKLYFFAKLSLKEPSKFWRSEKEKCIFIFTSYFFLSLEDLET